MKCPAPPREAEQAPKPPRLRRRAVTPLAEGAEIATRKAPGQLAGRGEEPAGPTTLQQPHRLAVHLAHSRRARLAIVHHEIFSPPKALRHGAEMWDI